jgi:hypothetical protein
MSQTEAKRSNESELYDILSNDRKRLPDFLEKMGDYHMLVDLIKKIEAKYPAEPDVWKQLMLGKKGGVANAKKALYELPTKELLHVITVLLLIFEIKQVDELACGQGLLSLMLQRSFRKEGTAIRINASDSLTWVQTSDSSTYPELKIAKKSMYDYYNEIDGSRASRFFQDKRAVIVSWLYNTFEEEFLDLLREGSTYLYIMIGEGIGKSCLSTNAQYKIAQLGYKTIQLPVLQLCYNDYFLANKFHSDETCRSMVTLYLNPHCSYTTESLINACGMTNFAVRVPDCLSEKEIIQDLCVDKLMPIWVYKLDDEKMKTACRVTNLVYKYRSIFQNARIPDYITDIDELRFWVGKKILKKYPMNIADNATLKTYMNIIKDLHGNLAKYKEEKKLPAYITDEEKAEQYFWLDYSTSADDKAWKLTLTAFNAKFESVYGIHTLRSGDSASLFNALFGSMGASASGFGGAGGAGFGSSSSAGFGNTFGGLNYTI